MVVLTGKNLGERHRELNNKVREVIVNKKDFNDIKNEKEETDVDKLYKIDIASHYKDLDYIVEVLKSGDSLYTSRALKCLWIYHDNCSHVINTENLHVNIFPYTSLKMKKKMLTTLSMHIKNPERAASFYIYCKKNLMPNIAFKFLIYTSEEFKLNVLKNENVLSHINDNYREGPFLQNFIGNSLVLATTCIEMSPAWRRSKQIYELRHLYATSSEKYLDILEKYEIVDLKSRNALKQFGARTSKDIMLKYKNRVLKNPLLYVYKLKKSMLTKYSSKTEAKAYLSSLIPKDVKEFWEINFCKKYDYILNSIPINEQFEYMKQLFTETYSGESFEMSFDFYQLEYYNMMTIDQRELWALRHIDEQNAIFGEGPYYLWYKFVNIDKAFIEIKKYIMITAEEDKRASLINTLVEAARDHKDLKKVLDYYYDRHINEKTKVMFIDRVLKVHNVFEFDIECWEALNKLFYSLDIYSVGRRGDKEYTVVALFYHILHNMEMPKALINFIDLDVNYIYFRPVIKQLGEKKSELVLQYLLNFFADYFKPFEQDPHNKTLIAQLKMYVGNILNLLSCFEKKEDHCPEIVKKFMDIHLPKPKENKTAKDIFFYIKSDATLAINALGHSDLDINCHSEMTNNVLRKLKVYFYSDVAQEYVKFLDRMIQESSDDNHSHKLIDSAIFGIIQLSDERLKLTLMEKYHPSKPKIKHHTIDRKLLYIQEAICRYVGYSRPPVPLKNVLQYIKGDYVQYCIPMFNMYLVNLPFPLAMKFIESILDAPLSVQKHGLRLAFQCYTNEILKPLILDTWNKTKNASLRMIIYTSLFKKITAPENKECDDEIKTLYETLKFFTSDLHQDDHRDVFNSMTCQECYLPKNFIGDYLQTAWNILNTFPKNPINIKRQIKVIDCIEQEIKLVQRNFMRKTIIDEHVHDILEHRQLRPGESREMKELWDAKWYLTAAYIVQYDNTHELEDNLTLLSHIFGKCLVMWQHRYEETFIFQQFYFQFLSCVEYKSDSVMYNSTTDNCTIPIFKYALDFLTRTLPLRETYLMMWNLKLIIYIGISLKATNAILREGNGKVKPLFREEFLSDSIGNHIGHFVQELLAKNQFYPVYLPSIAGLLKKKLHLYEMRDLDVFVCRTLAKFELYETHLLALMLLPDKVTKKMKDTHTKVLMKIQAFENDEVRSFLNYKFLSPYKPMTLASLQRSEKYLIE